MSTDGYVQYLLKGNTPDGGKTISEFNELNPYGFPSGAFSDSKGSTVWLAQELEWIGKYLHRFEQAESDDTISNMKNTGFWYPEGEGFNVLWFDLRITQLPPSVGIGGELLLYRAGYAGFLYNPKDEIAPIFGNPEHIQFASQRFQANKVFPTGIFWCLPPDMVAEADPFVFNFNAEDTDYRAGWRYSTGDPWNYTYI